MRKLIKDIGQDFQKALQQVEKENIDILHDIFGDAQWTNKNRFTDEKMIDLIVSLFKQIDIAIEQTRMHNEKLIAFKKELLNELIG